MQVPRLAIKDRGWIEDIKAHRLSVGLWLSLNLLDWGLTTYALTVGATETNWFLNGLSPVMFGLYKVCLTIAAIVRLSMWKRLCWLKWLNFVWVVLAITNIYEVIGLIW